MTAAERQALRWRDWISRRAGASLSATARLELAKHNMELEKVRGQRLYIVYDSGTGPPAGPLTEDGLRQLLIRLRERGE